MPPLNGQSSDKTPAVYGLNTDNGDGVVGETGGDITTRGVWGNHSGVGTGVFGSSQGGSGVYGLSQISSGVFGETNAEKDTNGVWGNNNHSGTGVFGTSQNGSGVYGLSQTSSGVFGETNAEKDTSGVWGNNKHSGTGVFGTSQGGSGVYGLSQTSSGVFGETNGTKDSSAVWGNHTGAGTGVRGTSQHGWGIFGSSVSAPGVQAESIGADGVLGMSFSNAHAGVSAINNSGGIGLYAKGSGGEAARFEGNITVTGDILLPAAADFAEHFDIAEVSLVEPGTVMVINGGGALEPSQEAYDKKVAGVISGAGKYKPGIILDKEKGQFFRQPLALVGKVYCKVDAGYGPIEVGCLLTTSPTPGHAMRADDPFKAFGAVIGKAMEPLDSGQGLIAVLVALQ